MREVQQLLSEAGDVYHDEVTGTLKPLIHTRRTFGRPRSEGLEIRHDRIHCHVAAAALPSASFCETCALCRDSSCSPASASLAVHGHAVLLGEDRQIW